MSIVRTDPDLILSASVTGLDENLRASSVEAFLAGLDAGAIPFSFGLHWHYKKLAHRGLAPQLRPYIKNRTRSGRARHEAIGIARMCEEKGVQSDLAVLALDDSEELDLRASAACAVASYADADVKARLRPLTEGIPADTNDELKGCALIGLWPAQMTAEEMFSVLTPPKRGLTFHGSYSTFMWKPLSEGLRASGLPFALRWIEQMLANQVSGVPLETIASTVFSLAWANLDSPGVLELFAAVLRLWLERAPYLDVRLGESLIRTLHDDDTKRRRLVEAMVPEFSNPSRALLALEFHNPPLVFQRDLPWMCERLVSSPVESTRAVWAKLISRMANPADVDNFGRVIDACGGSSELEAELHHLIAPVELGSPQARALQEQHRDEEEQHQRLQSPQERPSIPPAQERIDACLDRFESGQLDAWWHVNGEMLWNIDGTASVHDSEADLTALPGWKVSPETQGRLLRAASVYITEADPRTSDWLGTDTLYRPAWAGYRALRLALYQQPQLLEDLPADVWRKWSPMILAYPTYTEADRQTKAALLKRAIAHAPRELAQTAQALIEKEDSEDIPVLPSLDALRECWSTELEAVLLEKLGDARLKPSSTGHILSLLLEHDVQEAPEFCRSLLVVPTPGPGVQRQRALVAAKALIAHTRDASWAAIWPIIRDDAAFGREIVEGLMPLGFDVRAGSIAEKLTDDQVADLYVWLVREYPYSDDPVRDGAYAIGPRDMVRQFRESVRESLKNRGTAEACKAIERLVRELPELPWLNQVLLEAQRLARERSWAPPTVQEIIRLTTDPNVRLVGSGSQLIDVLIESLEGLQQKLIGETPRSRFLWNETLHGKWRPKEEEALSDYLKGHLEDDLTARGIVLGREVQIRRRAGRKPGEDTDIYVTAVRKSSSGGSFDAISAVVEVKGCWHKELKAAMQSQLVERYLKDSRCGHGLYLVGWFNCDSWDEGDSRQNRAPKWTADEAAQFFDSQATKLSAPNLLIRAFVIDIALR